MIEQKFLEEMLSKGLQPGTITADGNYHRFDIRKGDKAGYYSVNTNGFGIFGNWKTSEQFKFRAGVSQEMTEQERLEAAAKYKAEIRKRKEDKENAEARSATEANKIWEAASAAPENHWYLVKKKIQTHDFRVDATGTLLFPIYDNKKIVNLQRVLKDGKRFVFSAKKRGCYGKIDGERDVIFIAEGFATAASINEATGKLVIVALDAGNLGIVAREIREKFGVSQKIIIAGDDDQWTEIKGSPHNTGRIEAEKAAQEIYADVKFTSFPVDDELRRSDWNDFAFELGLEATRDELLPEQAVIINGHDVGEHHSGNEASIIELDLNGEGRPKNTIENLDRVVRKNNITLRYNIIKKQEEIIIPNEGYSLDNNLNASFARIVSLCKEEDMQTSQIGDYLTYLSDKNQYNPVTTWITSKDWDGKSRLQEFFDTIQSPTKELKDLILTRWMTSAVASAFSACGLSTRGVLVFQSNQYLGKTSWFKKLCPAELEVRKDGCILRLDDKDSIYQCVSHWLVELGELDATFKKSDIAQLKAFIPLDKDIIRRPYARKESQFGRRTVFFGSVNAKEFLSDETGNTRFWSIAVTDINYNHSIDMQQVWAEFYAMYLNKESYIMSGEEIAMINDNNEEFMGPDYHDELVSRKFDWEELQYGDGSWKTATEISRVLSVQNPKQQDLNRISKAVKKYNGNRVKKSNGVRLLLVPREKLNYDSQDGEEK